MELYGGLDLKKKEDILKLWLDWVEKYDSHTENQGHIACHFCGIEYIVGSGITEHKDDCVYRMTEEYIGE